MTDRYKPLVKGIIAALKADSTIAGLVGARVYTEVPQNATFPYLFVFIRSLPYDTKDTNGQEHTVQISAFSRDDTPEEAADLRAAVYSILHKGESNVTLDSGTVTNSLFTDGQIAKEDDGVTWQGISRFRILTD